MPRPDLDKCPSGLRTPRNLFAKRLRGYFLIMTLEDDAALSVYEWVEWLESRPELDVPACDSDNRLFFVVLADDVHTVESYLWELLIGAVDNS